MINWAGPMRRLCDLFSQTATICLAVLFVVSTLKPEWLPSRAPQIAVVQQEVQPGGAAVVSRPDSYHGAVKKAMPSVVNISTSKEMRIPRNSPLNDPLFRRFFGDDPQKATSLGSGVIVSSSGYILTNNHVVEAADEIEVSLSDGKKLIATVVGSDPETDLAVLRVEAKEKDLPAITFGSSDTLRVGDVVLAIGNPFGFGQTVTAGIVSALGRSGLGINVFEKVIQTVAPKPGQLGGALVDERQPDRRHLRFFRERRLDGHGFASRSRRQHCWAIIKSGHVTLGGSASS